MQQLSKTCQVADHFFKEIQYICVYPQCQLSRFLCSKCTIDLIHKHSQSDNSHILDNRDFYERIKNNLSQAKGNLQQKKYYIENSFIVPLKQILYEIQNNDLYEKIKNDLRQAKGKIIQKKYDIERFFIVPLKQILLEIQNFLKNVQNIVQQVGQDKLQNINIYHLENQLLNIQKYGFDQIDDQSLNNLINISKYQQDLNIYKQLEDQANLILQNAQKIKEWRLQQVQNKQQLQQSQLQKIIDAKYQIQQIDDTGDKYIQTGALSNNLKYIVSGGEDKLLKIWDYQSNKLIKSIKLNSYIWSCKFTEDSTLLYAGSSQYVYQFDVQNEFKELYNQKIHNSFINCIYCISNTIILTSDDFTIIKTDVEIKQQLLKIQAHNYPIYALDFNKNLDIIASVQADKSIKLWNGDNGSLILEKLNANNNDSYIIQVLFIINNDQLISLDLYSNLIIWNINYKTKQLELFLLINYSGYNISLVLQQQFIIGTGQKFIKVYSIKGEFVRQFEHEVDQIYKFNTMQLDSMKAVLIKGLYKLLVCKLNID